MYARCSSTRLPGKVLYSINDEKIIGIVLRKLNSTGIDTVVLTSEDPSDDDLAEWLRGRGHKFLRGDLDNPTKRTLRALEEYPCDFFFRVNADSPFLQTTLLEQAKDALKENVRIDLVTNIVPRTYPYGIAVELISSHTFRRIAPSFSAFQQEHITNFFYANLDDFQIYRIKHQEDLSPYRLVLDTEEDWKWLQLMVKEDKDIFDRPIKELIQIIDKKSR